MILENMILVIATILLILGGLAMVFLLVEVLLDMIYVQRNFRENTRYIT